LAVRESHISTTIGEFALPSRWTDPVPQALQRHTGCQLRLRVAAEPAPPLAPPQRAEQTHQTDSKPADDAPQTSGLMAR